MYIHSDFCWFLFCSPTGFFDFYIIPLTQKLKDCGVFGVSSDEFLGYAKKNRAEWEAKGESVVAEILAECKTKYGVKGVQLERGNKIPRGAFIPMPIESFDNEFAIDGEVDV